MAIPEAKQRCRTTLDHRDKTLLLKSMIPLQVFIALGMVVAAFLPWKISLAIVAVLLSQPLMKLVGSARGTYTHPLTKLVVPGRRTVKIDGDFAVFIIGARANRSIDGFFRWMGDAFGEIQQELEALPLEETGYLGGESYIGAAGQGPMTIQYWRSLEHLNAYARSTSNKHSSSWRRLMAKGKETSDYGFWHESFSVRAGEFQCVYVNSMPLGLGNCRTAELIPCTGKNNSAAGRAGKSDGKDWPLEFGDPGY